MASSPARPICAGLDSTVAPLGQPPVLTDVLPVMEQIFLRIASPVDLARASAACSSFHRIITDPSFLRRYRALHPPLLLGYLDDRDLRFEPAEAPHPAAPAGRAFARAADFSSRNAGSTRSWRDPCDVRDGRVLLRSSAHGIPDLAAYDPLSRRSLELPLMPGDLLDSVQFKDQEYEDVRCRFQAFLVPSGGHEEEEEASFKVVVVLVCADKMAVFVFSSGSGSWSLCASTKYADLNLQEGCLGLPKHAYAYGCLYWKVFRTNKLVKLDMERREFSTVGLPPGHEYRQIFIVEAGEGTLGMFSACRHASSLWYYTCSAMQKEGRRANEWQTEKTTVPLPCTSYSIIGAPEGYIVVIGIPTFQGADGPVLFSVEAKTLEVERVNHVKYVYDHVYPYFGFPPSMCSTRI